jgi:excisionase family DNA binding protein
MSEPFAIPPPAIGAKPSAPALALNVETACAALSVSYDTWREHIEPEIRLVRLGRRKLIPVAELERWLADRAENVLERKPPRG